MKSVVEAKREHLMLIDDVLDIADDDSIPVEVARAEIEKRIILVERFERQLRQADEDQDVNDVVALVRSNPVEVLLAMANGRPMLRKVKAASGRGFAEKKVRPSIDERIAASSSLLEHLYPNLEMAVYGLK